MTLLADGTEQLIYVIAVIVLSVLGAVFEKLKGGSSDTPQRTPRTRGEKYRGPQPARPAPAEPAGRTRTTPEATPGRPQAPVGPRAPRPVTPSAPPRPAPRWQEPVQPTASRPSPQSPQVPRRPKPRREAAPQQEQQPMAARQPARPLAGGTRLPSTVAPTPPGTLTGKSAPETGGQLSEVDTRIGRLGRMEDSSLTAAGGRADRGVRLGPIRRLSRGELQRIFAFNEVLAPPVALREEPPGQF